MPAPFRSCSDSLAGAASLVVAVRRPPRIARDRASVLFLASCVRVFSALLCADPACAVSTQDYPTRPITLVSPAAAGGSNEVVKSVIFDRLATALGVPIVMESRGGAGGAIGASIAAKAAPDGYTLLIAGASVMATNPATRKDLPYDAIRDFTPIVVMIDAAAFLVAHQSVPARNAREFVDWLRARPGWTNYGSYGPGSSNFLGYELFKQVTGTDVVHVPYRGSAPLLAALLAGEVQSAVEYYPTMRAHVDTGTIRVLGVASPKRSRLLPDVPTLAEQGFPVEAGGVIMLVAPAGLPAPIADRLNVEMNAVLAMPEVRRRMAEIGYEVVGGSRTEAERRVVSEIERWKRLVQDIRYQPD